jgi:signal transduction histidine kinase/CheY-like chemotaxis protein
MMMKAQDPDQRHGSHAVAQAVARVSRLLLKGGSVDLQELLGILGRAVDVDRCYLFRFRDGAARMDNTHEWCSPAAAAQIQNLQDLETAPHGWILDPLRQDREHAIRDASLLPEAAAFEKQFLAAQGIKALLLVPMHVAGELKGFVGFDDTRGPRRWKAGEVLLLRTTADLFAAYFERRRAEEALDFERRQLLAVFESIEFSIYVADPGTYRILYANNKARTFGRPLVGELCYAALQNKSGQCEFCNNAALLAEPQRPLRWEFHNPVTERDYIIYNRLIRWPDGRDVRFELDVDITELNRGRRLQLRAERLESLSLLAGGIAHDFNNLLTGILGNLSLVRELAAGREDLAEYLLEAEKAAVRARSLTGQLLGFTKSGPVRPRESVDLPATVREAATFSLRGSNVRFRLRHDEGRQTVLADEAQLSQAIQNLMLNAAQAMPDGGIIDIEVRSIGLGPAEHPLLRAGSYALVGIADRGPGIPAELRDLVFDPFFTTKPNGTGLGLTSAHAILRQFEGALELVPRPGGGTEARFYLPLAPEPRGSGPAEGTPPPRPGRGRILVMDDEAMVRKTSLALLRTLGCEAEAVAGGEEAVDAYRRAMEEGRPFHVVILDLTVPGGIGGEQALSRLREVDRGVQAVASSGYSADLGSGNQTERGFAAFLPKPYTLSELSRVLGSLLPDRPAD